MIKWLPIPPPISFGTTGKGDDKKPVEIDGKTEWDMAEWLDGAVVYDRAFGKGIVADRARKSLPLDVADAIERGENACPITADVGACLAAQVKAPQTPQHPVLSVKCLPFAEACLALLDERPKAEDAPEEVVAKRAAKKKRAKKPAKKKRAASKSNHKPAQAPAP